MKINPPSRPEGTRDFSPEVMAKRNYILQTIRTVYQRYGFLPLETPAMENLDVLTGKYGDEGDQLIFKILNSGDYLEKLPENPLELGAKKLSFHIAKKALRYDLTVPFARYVVMNRGTLTFPFKRYQIQPVWRGDRPQKGRYREFYQCDADVVGTTSLLCEAEIILMINEVLGKLGVQEYQIKMNHRQILNGIAEAVGELDKFSDLCVAIDKLDKIGLAKVLEELKTRGFQDKAIEALQPVFEMAEAGKTKEEKLAFFEDLFQTSEKGRGGVADLKRVFALLQGFASAEDFPTDLHIDFDPTLARGLSYYTGAIFEVKVSGVQVGSISGGGRYDNLTGAFGVPDIAGVGFSFGVDRLYDVLEELNLFPAEASVATQILLIGFEEETFTYCLPMLYELRQAGFSVELYPTVEKKLTKQMTYANARKIPYVVLVGSDEMQAGEFSVKDMLSGVQERVAVGKLKEYFMEKF